ncbi:MAG: carbohydrate ABC transporter permease [Spirochaetaceae bacterium]|jgi:raffinose/stachyose/melibiose transport system permease protein|nr:carbohydrate ABC transporter permease [Spirochaetaceae bacterium]
MKQDLKTPSVRIIRALILLYCGFNIAVILYMFYNSLRMRTDFLSHTFALPKSLGFGSYIKLLGKDKFLRYFFNSVFILTGAIALSVFLSSTVAYALGHYQFKFKKFLKTYFLVGLMFPIQLGIVPIFLLMKDLNLINTYTSVILICGSSISMSVFLLTNFFAGLPVEFYEAAILDGAGEFRTFIRIMFPLASPVVFSMSILTAVNIWNQFFVPLIFLQSDTKKTVPLMVIVYTRKLLMTIDSAFAASILSTVPILILFVIFSAKILNSIAEGGIKG